MAEVTEPSLSPILTEVAGVVRFEDIKDGVTMRQELDPQTKRFDTVIVEHKGEYQQNSLRYNIQSTKMSKFSRSLRSLDEHQTNSLV